MKKKETRKHEVEEDTEDEEEGDKEA
jgi:hypothetical protein